MTDGNPTGPVALYAMFSLDGISEDEYLRYAEEIAPRFAEIDGLISKVWLTDPATGRFGALYLYESRDAVAAFLSSDFGQEQARTPFCRDIVVQELQVLPGPSKVTRALA